MVRLPEWYEPALERQLKMNPQTWETLRAHGVTEESALRLDFFYACSGEAEARRLTDFIRAETDYDVDVRAQKKGMLSKKSWAVVGTTQPTSISLDILNEWVQWMVLAGAEKGPCEFDGWGAQAR